MVVRAFGVVGLDRAGGWVGWGGVDVRGVRRRGGGGEGGGGGGQAVLLTMSGDFSFTVGRQRGWRVERMDG